MQASANVWLSRNGFFFFFFLAACHSLLLLWLIFLLVVKEICNFAISCID